MEDPIKGVEVKRIRKCLITEIKTIYNQIVTRVLSLVVVHRVGWVGKWEGSSHHTLFGTLQISFSKSRHQTCKKISIFQVYTNVWKTLTTVNNKFYTTAMSVLKHRRNSRSMSLIYSHTTIFWKHARLFNNRCKVKKTFSKPKNIKRWKAKWQECWTLYDLMPNSSALESHKCFSPSMRWRNSQSTGVPKVLTLSGSTWK